MAKLTTTELVTKIYNFCEAYSGVHLFPYQQQFGKRIIRSVLENDGDEITALFARQCIPKGSVIHTRDGKLVKIEEHPNAWLTRENADIIEIRVKGGYSIKCTKNHPIKTNMGWIPAGLLEVGDLVEVLDSWDKFGDGIVPYKFKKYVNMYRTDTIEGVYVMNEELAELVGWLTADGYVTGKNQSIKFTNINTNYLNRVEYLVKKYFPDVITKRYTKGRGYDLLFTTNSRDRFNSLKDFIKIMRFNEDKFPEAVNDFTREQTIAFFKGMFASDGYVYVGKDGKNIEIGLACGNSRVYAEFCRELLNKLGISSQIKEEIHKKSTKPFFRLVIAGQRNARIFKEVIGDILDEPIPEYIFDAYTRENRVYTFRDVDGEWIKYSHVVSIRDAGKADVYDVEYPEKGWFISGGIKLHNSGKSETVSTVCGGLSIILPVLANMPMFETDPRLNRFKGGFMIGIFAPTLRQSQIVFNRMKKRMSSASAVQILSDPEINLGFAVSNGQNVLLSNGYINSLISCQSASEGSNIEGDSYMLIIVDEAQDVSNFKYLKSISPMGAFYNATKILIGTPTTQRGFFLDSIERNKAEYEQTGKRNHFEYDYQTVIKYNPQYAKYVEGEKKRLGEHSDEFKMSYALKWILDRGMFVDYKLFESLALPDEEVSIMDTQKPHIAGIDLGKKNDSTVITILEVDWDNPILIEKAQSGDMNVPDYTAYNTRIKAWKEIQGDNWNEQYDMIREFLSNFNVVRVVMDATGVGDAIYDRLRANLDIEVIPYVFSRQGKSDLYKHLNTEIRAKRVKYPAGERTRETIEFQKFQQQMLDLEKSYSGQLLVVSHPSVAGAHDDFPDSLALAVWGAKGEPMARPITESSPLFDRQQQVYSYKRNMLTARRR